MTRDYQHAIKTLEGNKTRNDMNMREVMDIGYLKMGYGFWSGVEKWIKKEFFDKGLPYLAHSPWLNLYNFGCFWVIQNLISVFSYEIFKYLYVLSLKNVLKYGCRALVNTGTRGRLGGCARNFWGMYLVCISIPWAHFWFFCLQLLKMLTIKSTWRTTQMHCF